MGRILDEDVQRVRDATDIISLVSETVVLKRKGRLFWGNCPFHGEKTPSFKVDPATQLWHCFGCGQGGDVYGFVMRRENMDFPDAVRHLAERARIELRETAGGMPAGRRERLIAVCDAAASFYHRELTSSRSREAQKARDYLHGRGFGIEVAKRFRLGYAPGRGALVRHLQKEGFTAEEIEAANLGMKGDRGMRDRFYERVMFPICDLTGRTIAFGGRVLGAGEPKYLNSAETPVFSKSSNLYAVNWAKSAIVKTGTVVVVEGYTDVIALHLAGIENVVATLGTALTARHLKLLARFAQRVVYLFDGDEAGLRAADRAAGFMEWQATPETGRGGLDLAVTVLPDGADPADFVASHGADAVRELIDSAVPLLRFVLDRRLAGFDVRTPEGRAAALASVAGVLSGIRESVLVHDYAEYVAGRLSALAPHVAPLTGDSVSAAVARAKASPRHEGAPDEERFSACDPQAPLDPQTVAERELLRLVSVVPRLRPQARELLAGDIVSDPGHLSVLQAVLDAGPAAGRDLVEAVSAAEPTAVGMLSEWFVTEQVPEDAERDYRLVVRRLQEFGLQRRIAQLKARMKHVDPVKDRSTYDELFETIVRLGRELHELRQDI